MACDHIDGAIVCSRRRVKRCHHCPQRAPYLCDWKIAKGKTCDTPICATHAQEVAKDKHLCPAHQEAYKAWLERRAAPEEFGSDEARQTDADMAAALELDWKGG